VIVISGVLVLVALGLLLAGVAAAGDAGLRLIELSILASVVSGVFLVAGVLQRRRPLVARGRTASAAPPAPARVPPAPDDDDDRGRDATVAPAGTAVAEQTAPVVVPPLPDGVGAGTAGIIFVVDGQPRYHLEDCPQLDLDVAEPLEVEEARETGFHPCPQCRPDEVLGLAAADVTAVLADLDLDLDAPDEPVPAQRAGGAAATAGSVVVVVPGRGRYHRPGCRYGRDVAGTMEMTLEEAQAAGYRPCAVCGS
jgi:hypothetical protein